MIAWKGIAGCVLEEAGVTEAGQVVRVPYRTCAADEHNAKLFADGRSWWERSGVEQTLFGLETLPSGRFTQYCAVIIAEGESDTLAARQALDLYQDARAVRWLAVGCPGAGSWKPEWASHLRAFSRIYVCGDGDAPGRRFNHRVRHDLPWARLVPLPDGEDLRSVAQHDPDTLLALLDTADRQLATEAALHVATDVAQWERLASDPSALATALEETGS